MYRPILCLSLILAACSQQDERLPMKKPIDGTSTATTTATTTTGTTTTTTSTTTTPTNQLIGSTYSLDISGGTWVQPPGVGALLSALVAFDLLLGIDDVQPPDLYMMGAMGSGAGQDMCVASFEFPVPADFSADPSFELQASQLILDLSGIPLLIEDVLIAGEFSADLSRIENVVFEGTMDLSTLDLLVGGDTCDLMATFGIACGSCPAGSADTCLVLEVNNLTANRLNGVTLQTITQADIASNPSCP